MNEVPDRMLLLAASRGPDDALARQAGVVNKCLIPVAGLPMIDHVIAVLREINPSATIGVAVHHAETLNGSRAVCDSHAAGKLRIVPAAATPSGTILAAMTAGHLDPPFLITTADHPLLTADMVRTFWRSVPAGADAAVGVASAATIRAAWPETRRTYVRLSGGSYSGCNLFAIMTGRARRAIEFWEGAEARRKDPLAMIRLLGPAALLRFLTGTLSLAGAVRRVERLTGTRLAPVEIPFAEAAVDVDKPEDLALVRRILETRSNAAPAAAREVP